MNVAKKLLVSISGNIQGEHSSKICTKVCLCIAFAQACACHISDVHVPGPWIPDRLVKVKKRHCGAKDLTGDAECYTDIAASGSDGLFSFEYRFTAGGSIPRSVMSTIVLTIFPFVMILVFYLSTTLLS